jgi:hypothetical protein
MIAFQQMQTWILCCLQSCFYEGKCWGEKERVSHFSVSVVVHVDTAFVFLPFSSPLAVIIMQNRSSYPPPVVMYVWVMIKSVKCQNVLLNTSLMYLSHLFMSSTCDPCPVLVVRVFIDSQMSKRSSSWCPPVVMYVWVVNPVDCQDMLLIPSLTYLSHLPMPSTCDACPVFLTVLFCC